jgi:hypothetical protein
MEYYTVNNSAIKKYWKGIVSFKYDGKTESAIFYIQVNNKDGFKWAGKAIEDVELKLI